MNNQLSVEIEPDISIVDLLELQTQGFSVQRSAHIGNQQPYNMSLMASGIPMLLVDHTVTGVDKAYRPEQILEGLSSRVIAEAGQLASRTIVDIDGERRYIDEAHNQSIMTALPGAVIETSTEYARRNEPIFRAVIDAALETMPEIFTRTVSENTVNKVAPSLATGRAVSTIEAYGIMQLNDDPREGTAVMLPNEVDIVANYLAEAITSNSDTIYHLSGPDMVVYSTAKKTADQIEKLYVSSSKQPGIRGKLPEKLSVVLVPTADARFATTAQRSTQINSLLQTMDKLTVLQCQFRRQKAEFFKSKDKENSAMRTELLDSEKLALAELSEELRNVTLECVETVSCYKGSPFISQYDVAKEGGLFVAPFNTTATMSELSLATKLLRKITKDKIREPT